MIVLLKLKLCEIKLPTQIMLILHGGKAVASFNMMNCEKGQRLLLSFLK